MKRRKKIKQNSEFKCKIHVLTFPCCLSHALLSRLITCCEYCRRCSSFCFSRAQIQCYVVICDAFQAECHPASAAQQWKSDVVNMAPSPQTLTKHVQFYRCKKQPTPPTFCFPWVIYLIFSLSRALLQHSGEKTATVWEEVETFCGREKKSKVQLEIFSPLQ